jgi:hypothetical protein
LWNRVSNEIARVVLLTPKGIVFSSVDIAYCLRRGELGDSLGSLRDGVLGEFTRKHETDSGLDLAAGKGGLLVVSGKLSGFGGNALEDIVDEGVHDGHTLLGDTSIGVDLLEDLVNVRGVALRALLFLSAGTSFLGNGSLLGRLLGGSLGHLKKEKNIVRSDTSETFK